MNVFFFDAKKWTLAYDTQFPAGAGLQKPTWGPLWASSMSLRKDTWQHSSHPSKKLHMNDHEMGFPEIDIGVMSLLRLNANPPDQN